MNGLEWSGVEWSGAEGRGVERKGVEWSEVECIERALGKIVLHKPGIEVSNIYIYKNETRFPLSRHNMKTA